MTTKLYPYTIQDTGVTVQIRKVSQMLLREAVKDLKEPQPPSNEVTTLDGKKEYVTNEADPTYLQDLQDYKIKLSEVTSRIMIKWGIVYQLTEEDKKLVAQLKETWREDRDEDLKGSDTYIFLNYIALGTKEDIQEIVKAITRRTQATPEATQEALDRFPDQVPGSDS